MPRLWTSRALSLTVLFWASLIWGQESNAPQDVKPERCEGVATIAAVIPEIKDLDGHELNVMVGNMSYSLAMTGNLSLTSTMSTWHCGVTHNTVVSNGTMRTLTTVFAAGQQSCYSDPLPVDSTWLTNWNTLVFSGEVFFSVNVHDMTCGSPTTLLNIVSPCAWNASTEGGLRGTGLCRWNLTDKVHHAGDKEEGTGDENGQNGDDGQGGGDGGTQ
ncbi:hypothetical protein CROQUDRAFT_39116 [Cronartium quercuum f. sp. fusiforme G11]|uniref:Uncharacterized protein n=1 Tax=Cronartium quercuum f. sp. fusiforme G11 TaxID=708437 RepID=A0A9P6NV08_9BASI|nr:hypothetical protein CROQUDRAFT_39116 [Cronartium quercuum f. sp. fusiforme G11]